MNQFGTARISAVSVKKRSPRNTTFLRRQCTNGIDVEKNIPTVSINASVVALNTPLVGCDRAQIKKNLLPSLLSSDCDVSTNATILFKVPFKNDWPPPSLLPPSLRILSAPVQLDLQQKTTTKCALDHLQRGNWSVLTIPKPETTPDSWNRKTSKTRGSLAST